ncbi:MAG TPA: TlpA disulfide reductase family protein [Mucilaginibacter sp.]
MKTTTLLSLTFFACLAINPGQKAGGKPFSKKVAGFQSSNRQNNAVILTAELVNFKGTSVLMRYNNKLNEEVIDTLSVNNGRFTIPASLIPGPQIVAFYITVNDQFNMIQALLAPGYQLSLKADVNNWAGRNREIHWDGTGSVINNFYTEINKHPQYYDRSGKEPFDNWYQRSKITTDSLFSKCSTLYNDAHDPNYSYFKNLIYADINFNRLDAILGHAYQLLDTESPTEVDKYITANFDITVLKDISNSSNLASPAFKNLMGFSYGYLYYSFKHDNKVNQVTFSDNYSPLLKKASAIFRGDVRDYVFYKFMNLYLDGVINTYEEFKAATKNTMPYLDSINSKRYRDKLLSLINNKEYELSKYKIGNTAQAFSLIDNKGNTHTLADFKGKVVLIDFWASSCAPCREETPYLNKLYKKYQTDSQVQFVSIAVRDKKDAWQQALHQDKPEWLQLFDGEGKTSHYFTNAIPKFVLIDKAGLIVNLDAPEPSNGNALETLIKIELEKDK